MFSYHLLANNDSPCCFSWVLREPKANACVDCGDNPMIASRAICNASGPSSEPLGNPRNCESNLLCSSLNFIMSFLMYGIMDFIRRSLGLPWGCFISIHLTYMPE